MNANVTTSSPRHDATGDELAARIEAAAEATRALAGEAQNAYEFLSNILEDLRAGEEFDHEATAALIADDTEDIASRHLALASEVCSLLSGVRNTGV